MKLNDHVRGCIYRMSLFFSLVNVLKGCMDERAIGWRGLLLIYIVRTKRI